jgi:hypothetical protein
MRRIRRRLLAWVALLSGAAVGLLVSTPAWGQAVGVDQVTISGGDLSEPVTVRVEDAPRTCLALYREISWLTGSSGEAEEPAVELGPGYTIEVSIEGELRHRYDLYPLAEGGPRVYRPSGQPGDRKASEGWFFGRLSMPETLSAAGVRLPGVTVRLGGSGGGAEASDPTEAPTRQGLGLLTTWQDGLLLTAAVAVIISSGLAGVAFLIRRKV